MRKSDISRIYSNSNQVGQYILSLLNKFEVALAIDEENLILPSLLPTHNEITPSSKDNMIKVHPFLLVVSFVVILKEN